jgi:predicted nucleic acid-binding protein
MSVSEKKPQFIDANVVMYSLGGQHPLREPCKKILEKIKTRSILVVTNTEVLQEMLHRYFSIGRATLGEIAYKSMSQFCTVILPVRLQDTDSALELLKKHKDITSRDAIHAATMINNGIREILSADPHFDLISGIRRIDPMSF